jgi:hypothetical protein
MNFLSLKDIPLLWAWVKRYERSLAAFSMVAGFTSDNLLFRRIDLPNTQLIFAAYIAVAASSIAMLHYLEGRAAAAAARAAKPARPPQGPELEPKPDTPPEKPKRWRTLLPFATQFALGGLWSGFLVFYSRSAVVTASWPYLFVLTAIFIGNEVLKRYHARLMFTSILFFFAIFSYSIVTVPIYTHTIGKLTFLLSGVVALLLLIVFLRLLVALNKEEYIRARWQIALGVLAVYVKINVFYFMNVLPPLPLALARAGVYHDVRKMGESYVALGEAEPWYTRFGVPPVIHVPAGAPLSVYSAVFAPIKLSTRIVHRWRHYNAARHAWFTESTVSYPISGGRDGGFRGYTVKKNPEPGDWRVDIDTGDGHLIGRVAFKVEQAPTAPAPIPEVLK